MLSVGWKLHVLGISHKSANLALREQFYLDKQATGLLLNRLKEVCNIQEALVLSTCNRTEVYYQVPSPPTTDPVPDYASQIIHLLCQPAQMTKKVPLDVFYHLSSTQASIEHLFQVCLGLDAQVQGDQQIISQSKQAYELSTYENMAGPYLHRLMHSIFYTNKRIATQTRWRTGAASVPYAATQLIQQLLGENKQAQIIVIGLGAVGQDMLQQLSTVPNTQLNVSNRTWETAQKMTTLYPCQAIPFEQLPNTLAQYDVIITCLGPSTGSATTSLITKENLTSHRKNPLLLIDLSVPRTINQDLQSLPGVLLYNIDEIKEQTTQAMEQRNQALPRVQKIIQEQLDAFENWTEEMNYSPLIQQLKDTLEALRQEELAQHLKGMNTAESKKIEQITKGLIQRIMKYPVLTIKTACKRGEGDQLAKTLVDLFELKAPVNKPSE